MSQLEVNKINPATSTTVTLGDSGDTFNIVSGATLDINSGATIDATGATITGFGGASDEQVKVSADDTTAGFLNGKLVAGTSITLTEGSGGGDETLTIAYSTPATLPAASGVNLTALDAANLGSNIVPTARLGSGTASADVFLRGDSSWAEVVGGLSWQSVQTSSPITAVAGNAYPINTTSGAITMNLPAGVVGEQVGVVDYAGTFDSNALTIAANGSENIKGSTVDATMETERQAGTFTYVDATQGWVLTSAAPDPGVSQPVWPAATGPDGAAGVTDGDYKVHTFTATKSGAAGFVVSSVGEVATSTTLEYLVIAGGGSGGRGHGGGGGAGGYRNSYGSETSGGGGSSEASMTFPAVGQHTVTIGAGAGAISGSNGNGYAGSNSIFNGITSEGGGYGGYYLGSDVGGDGGNGGCGGGAGGGGGSTGTSGNGGSGLSNRGYAGGDGTDANSSYHIGGGGGGVGAVGADGVGAGGSSGAAGAGGAGLASSITGASVTRGGGGGGTGEGGNVTAGAGGSGGGGAGGKSTATATSGTANTGGGGGAAEGIGSSASGAGGSGVVIIRYKFQ
jgi:hypothetical protein